MRQRPGAALAATVCAWCACLAAAPGDAARVFTVLPGFEADGAPLADASLVVTCGGQTTTTADLSQAEFQLEVIGASYAAYDTLACVVPRDAATLFVTLRARRRGGDDDWAESTVGSSKTVYVQSGDSALGADYGNVPDGWLRAHVNASAEAGLRALAETDADGDGSATLAPAAWGTPSAASRFFRVSVDRE